MRHTGSNIDFNSPVFTLQYKLKSSVHKRKKWVQTRRKGSAGSCLFSWFWTLHSCWKLKYKLLRAYMCVCASEYHVTCCPGLIGDSVIPWVLMTGRIWLPITVAMIWPWALVRSWGVIGCTCSAGLPPPDWLEGPAELGISGIVPIIYKGGREEMKSAGRF